MDELTFSGLVTYTRICKLDIHDMGNGYLETNGGMPSTGSLGEN